LKLINGVFEKMGLRYPQEETNIKDVTVIICRLNIFPAVILGFFLLWTAGCATIRSTEEEVVTSRLPEKDSRRGVYHKVSKGETLWRIAKTYNVTVDDIIKANKIPGAAKIENNQLVFIPGADAPREVTVDVDKNQNEFIWPVQGTVISYFHHRRGDKINKGIDIKASQGDNVRAARTGKVVFADYLSGYGYTVILDHSDGLHSVYAKNAQLSVKLGDVVLKNSPIAQVGRSGNLAYLHFQIRKSTVADNPLHYLP
jgi:murein DD-endopeptidase MepM/ murein hydrolase activator NlpD